MILLQVFLAFVGFIIIMGLITLLAAVLGFRNAMRNLYRQTSQTTKEAESGSFVFEARPCPHCQTYLSEQPASGKCPNCGGIV